MSECRWMSSGCKGGDGLSFFDMLLIAFFALWILGSVESRDARMLAAVECLFQGQSPAEVIATPVKLRDAFDVDGFAGRIPRCGASPPPEATP